VTLPDPSINGQKGGPIAQGPIDFGPPQSTSTAPVPLGGNINPYPAGSAKGQQWAKEHPDNGQVQYDDQGYPLPTQQQIAAYQQMVGTSSGGIAPGQGAYVPGMDPPKPDSDNPYAPGDPQRDQWARRNNIAKQNELAKKAWQEQHKAQKKPDAVAPAQVVNSSATPFASSGIDLTKEGKGESFTDSIIQHFSEAGVPTVSNESQNTLDSFRASQPQDMSPYYDYASKLASAKIDNAMSSRGSYGSSNATGQIGAAEVALRAQQAKDTAQYGLDRYAAEGNLAGSADATDARANALNFEWTKGLSDMAFKSQDAGQDRNQLNFDNNFKVANAKASNYTDATDKAITGVGEATDAANNVTMGNAADQVSGANADANAAASHTASVMDSAKQFGTNYFNYNANEDANKRNADANTRAGVQAN
jgi:hypothetical protein